MSLGDTISAAGRRSLLDSSAVRQMFHKEQVRRCITARCQHMKYRERERERERLCLEKRNRDNVQIPNENKCNARAWAWDTHSEEEK